MVILALIPFSALMILSKCSGESTNVHVAPLKPLYEYRVATETSGATSYIFEGDNLPKLVATSAGIELTTVNRILRFLKLPKVDEPVPDRYSITGFRAHAGSYYWEDYPLGPLTLRASPCRIDYKWQACIWKVTVAANEKTR